MNAKMGIRVCLMAFVVSSCTALLMDGAAQSALNKSALKEQALEMFRHAYWSYMDHAYPADELMPLTCQGRIRGVTPNRGDVDDSLGNFSLTLVDTLDTLLVVGEYDEFERAVGLVVDEVVFDSNLVVSVFETNIRMVGGLLSSHVLAKLLQHQQPKRLKWYDAQLLAMAKDIADRLLPAFNTTSGLPYSRVHLRHGITPAIRSQKDTCTACGGTMILEFAALSRLTGDPIYEEKAKRAMDFLWQQRHRGSDLMGTVLDIQNGDWIRKDSGVGAGIDSYYEYCLKAYILLGDETYLERFNRHYSAVMKYVSQGPVFVDVHMHKPTVAARPFMDALQAFWPGLQVLKGDLKPAIETHEMLYQVIQKHRFLPEAFTHDFQVHWGQHPLRPEFVESTYFLYKATKDQHYLEVAAQIMNSMNKHVRVPCGFAGLKDVRSLTHEDRMDSYTLAETFKYLYMIFAEDADLLFSPDSYVFTTEAHFLPLSIAHAPAPSFDGPPFRYVELNDAIKNPRSCPNTRADRRGYARSLRQKLKNLVGHSFPSGSSTSTFGSCAPRRNTPPGTSPNTQRSFARLLRAQDFSAANPEHLKLINKMGIELVTEKDGNIQLVHRSQSVHRLTPLVEFWEKSCGENLQIFHCFHSQCQAVSQRYADEGVLFMQEMIQLSQSQKEVEGPYASRVVQVVSFPELGRFSLVASPAQFGSDLESYQGLEAGVVFARPFRACTPLQNTASIRGRIAIVERSDCMFVDKARIAQAAGAVGLIVIDHFKDSAASSSPYFAMSGDGKRSADMVVGIPAVFLFRHEGELLLKWLLTNPGLLVRLSDRDLNPAVLFENFLHDPLLYLSEPVLGQNWDEVIQSTTTTTKSKLEEVKSALLIDTGEFSCVNQGGIFTCFSKAVIGADRSNAMELMKELLSSSVCVDNPADGLRTCFSDGPAGQQLITVSQIPGHQHTCPQRQMPWDQRQPKEPLNAQEPLESETPIEAPPIKRSRKRKTKERTPIVEFVEQPGGGRKLRFHFSDYAGETNTPVEKHAAMHYYLVRLADETNIDELEGGDEEQIDQYKRMISKLIMMSIGEFTRFDQKDQKLLDRLALELQLK